MSSLSKKQELAEEANRIASEALAQTVADSLAAREEAKEASSIACKALSVSEKQRDSVRLANKIAVAAIIFSIIAIIINIWS